MVNDERKGEYQGIRKSGSGYQDDRLSGLKIEIQIRDLVPWWLFEKTKPILLVLGSACCVLRRSPRDFVTEFIKQSQSACG
jgi:hypothetical protein